MHTYLLTALAWARRNRRLIADRFLHCIGARLEKAECVLDVWHNYVTQCVAQECAPCLAIAHHQPLDRKQYPTTALTPATADGKVEWLARLPAVVEPTSAPEPPAETATSTATAAAPPLPPPTATTAAAATATALAEPTEPTEPMWVHRKGAAPADCGIVVIPGSRGTFSYVVKPLAGTPQVHVRACA